MLSEGILIGDLRLENRVLLAPLAGVSDVPFRRVCQQHGAGLTYVEMLSAVAVNRRSPLTMRMLTRHPEEAVLGVQVTGPSPTEIADAVRLLEREGFDTIDLNMGCPVRKIVNKGWGSAMLLDPRKVEDTVKACKDATALPLTAKIRLGYTRPTLNVDEIAERVSRAGADMITIHGRCRSEGYERPVDRAGIATGFAHSGGGIVRVANGDIMDVASARAMVDETGCDAVMVSRGALGNPWIFEHILADRDRHPTLPDWLEIVLRHAEYHQDHYGTDLGATVRFRKHLLWYVSGFPGCRPLRNTLSTVASMDEVRRQLDEWARALPPETVRHQTRQATHEPKHEMDREADRGVGHDSGSGESIQAGLGWIPPPGAG